MRNRTFARGPISLICAICFTAVSLIGCDKLFSRPVPACAQPGQHPLSFHEKDPHLKHHVLAVTGAEGTTVTSHVVWCDLDSNNSFTITFQNDSPGSITPPTSSMTTNGNCTGTFDITAHALNQNHLDGYKYTISSGGTTIADPHVIVVGGS
jgi:hypothetical protein